MKTLFAIILFALIAGCAPLATISDTRDKFQSAARLKAEETLCDDLSMKEYRMAYSGAERAEGYAKLCATRQVVK